MANAFCTQADLEVACGGAKVLLQLADPQRVGVPDADLVTDYLETGAAEIRSALEVKHEPETIANLDTPSLRRLKDANAALSARAAHRKGGLGMEMPEWVREAADAQDRFLDQIARGERRLGRVAGGKVAAVNQPAVIVDPDPQGTGISITAFRRNGFR